MDEIFHCEWLTQKGIAVKLFRYPYPASPFGAIFSQLQRDEGGMDECHPHGSLKNLILDLRFSISDFSICNLQSNVFPCRLQSSPQMLLFMRFDGIKGVQFILRKQGKKLVKVEPSFSHRKMFIHFSVIVVEVNLT
jgi:hypothetical protein